MRFMIISVLVLAAFVVTLVVCAPLRLRVEDALFRREPEPTVAATRPEPADEEPAPQAASGEGEGMGQIVRDVLAGEGIEGQPPQTEPAPAPPVAERGPTAAPPPKERPAGGPLKPWERVVLPPALRQVQFGMPSEQIKHGYPVAWTKQEMGELMLTHYPTPDRNTTVRFHFSGDSLYRIEVRMKPGGGQTRKQLYNMHQAQYAQLYARVPERSATRWSDGTVTGQIKLRSDGVELIFTCTAARR